MNKVFSMIGLATRAGKTVAGEFSDYGIYKFGIIDMSKSYGFSSFSSN